MRRSNEAVIHATPNPLVIEDPDELQLIDEWNSQWVKAWKTAVLEFAKPKILCKKSINYLDSFPLLSTKLDMSKANLMLQQIQLTPKPTS